MSRSGSVAALAVAGIAFLSCGGGGGGGAPDSGGLPDVPYVHEDAAGDAGRDATEGTGGNHPPVLSRVGDRVVGVGEALTIELSATDADGDDLSYSVYGDIPDGAKFDKAQHTFTWVPLQAGVKVYLTFVVSDGDAIDRETVEVKVVAEHTGHPPVFEPVSDLKVTPGKVVTLQLRAHDPDADPLQFSFVGQAPPGATLGISSGVFQWTPDASLDGQVVTVGFEVRDPGKLKDSMDVRFLVGDVKVGSPPELAHLSEQVATPGAVLEFTVSATDPDGDEVTLSAEAGMPEGATFDEDTGVFRWTPSPADAGRIVEVTFSAYDGTFKAFGTVTIAVERGTGACSDDAMEPNDDPAHAKPIAEGIHDLSICDTDAHPVDSDFFLVTLGAGETVIVNLTFEHAAGDIDCDLSLDGSPGTVIAASDGTSDEEHITYTSDEARDLVLAIYGVGGDRYASPYRLSIAIETAPPACQDDASEPNDTPGEATHIATPSDALAELVACPGDPDLFEVTLGKGDSLLAGVTPKSSAKVRLELLRPGGGIIVDQAGPGAGPLTVAVDSAEEAGPWLIRAYAEVAAPYALEVMVEEAPQPGCTPKSCPADEVCDQATGQCVMDWCDVPGDCPTGLRCIDTYCVDPCETDGDCREGFACKSFPEGRFCGQTGEKGSGKPCTYFSECGADRACLFPDRGGYCAVWGCSSDVDCPLDSWCIEDTGGNWCAAECVSNADCAVSAGFSCTPSVTVDGADADLCL